MHSHIFQISLFPLAKDHYIESDAIFGGDMATVDYAIRYDKEKRKEAIKTLAERWLPKGMFSVNPDGVSLTYKGGYTEWSQEYTAELQKRVAKIKPWNVMDYIGPAFQLQKFIVNPLDIETLFIIEFETRAEKSRSLMEMVAKMGIGDKLYFGSVFDYHF